MRALGPGSVSSFLKVILDVVFWVLTFSAGAAGAAMVAVLLLSFNPSLLGGSIELGELHLKGAWLAPLAAGLLLVAEFYLGGSLIIVGRLRRIFQTLIAGDPFHPANISRLRTIGGALAVLELGRTVLGGVVMLAGPSLHIDNLHIGGDINLTAWFGVLAVLVLAEVFREGARLRGEAELTI